MTTTNSLLPKIAAKRDYFGSTHVICRAAGSAAIKFSCILYFCGFHGERQQRLAGTEGGCLAAQNRPAAGTAKC